MAFVAAAAAGMSTLQMVGMAFSAVSAIGQMQAGRQQAAAYRAQAKQEELKAGQASIQHLQQGVATLRRLRGNISAVNARAAAGGLDPYSGSPAALKQYAQKAGTEEFYLTQENSQLALITGEMNAAQYNMAATQAKRQGMMSAVGTLGTAFATVGSIGGPGSGTPIGGVGGGGSVGGFIDNTLYPTTGSIGMPSMVG